VTVCKSTVDSASRHAEVTHFEFGSLVPLDFISRMCVLYVGQGTVYKKEGGVSYKKRWHEFNT
jgi:aromatic ring-opening dioxygenase LigB subunit